MARFITMIPLQTFKQQHLGFLLPAGLPDDYLATNGHWKGECVFIALPTQAELFSDPAFRVLAEHKDAGEHHLSTTNDGNTTLLLALSPRGGELFVRFPQTGPGIWGTRHGITEAKFGQAVRVPIRHT